MSTNPNMEAIETITVGETSVANITFSNIPQTYTDLVLVLSGRTTQSSLADSIYFTFNSSTSNFSSRVIYNDGSSASIFTQARYAGSQPGSTATTSTFSNIEIYIPGYTNNRNKSYLVDSVSENNSTTGYIYSAAGLWSDTSAINSIVLTPNAGSFVQHSTATLYGVTAFVGEQGGKATGGTVTSDSNYWYHTFTTSGTFIPNQNITADYLVIAGGGGGGWAGGRDAGGAGGLRSTVTATGGGGSLESALSLTAQSYAVLVGAGGAGGGYPTAQANKGNNSVFSTITSIGGGGGGVQSNFSTATQSDGGSGGGANFAGSGGSGTANQGFNGGGAGGGGGGGGGGAGAAGTSGSGNTGGNGGNGVSISALATATGTGVGNFYAGGGAGGSQAGTVGSAGSGGGGSANNNGTANTGGGAGGISADGLPTKSGGSGIVIIRYAK